MAGEYEKATTIEKAIHQIVNRRYLLPAIRRKLTWGSSQICVLFDLIMRVSCELFHCASYTSSRVL